jgi:hypothetical protein
LKFQSFSSNFLFVTEFLPAPTGRRGKDIDFLCNTNTFSYKYTPRTLFLLSAARAEAGNTVFFFQRLARKQETLYFSFSGSRGSRKHCTFPSAARAEARNTVFFFQRLARRQETLYFSFSGSRGDNIFCNLASAARAEGRFMRQGLSATRQKGGVQQFCFIGIIALTLRHFKKDS